MSGIILEVDGIQVKIEMSKYAIEKCNEMGITEYKAYSMINELGESILDMKDGEEFSILAKESNIAIICSINIRNLEIVVDIITVITSDVVWIERGIKVYKLTDDKFTIVNKRII